MRASQARLTRSRLVSVFSRFAAGSAVATVCSQVTFVLLFGILGASATVSVVLGFAAGAVPSFVLHRCWAWQRAGRVDVRGELLPYLGVIALNGLLATAITIGVDRLIASGIDDHAVRTLVLAVVFGASYLLLFVLKFVLLDRLVFGAAARRVARSRHQVPTITRA